MGERNGRERITANPTKPFSRIKRVCWGQCGRCTDPVRRKLKKCFAGRRGPTKVLRRHACRLKPFPLAGSQLD
jgi:hypothetical protein